MDTQDQLTNQEITELVKRLGRRPEVRVAQLEERIRELEKVNVEYWDTIHSLQDRIAKAREILLHPSKTNEEAQWLRMKALDALEGK